MALRKPISYELEKRVFFIGDSKMSLHYDSVIYQSKSGKGFVERFKT